MNEIYDVIIIGKGPAGLSSALYLSREGYNVLVIGENSILEKCPKLENYLGINSITGVEYLNQAELQVKNYGTKIEVEKVLTIHKENNIFKIITSKGEHPCISVILAMGLKKTIINIENLNNFIGKGVSYCVTCDGFFYRSKKVAVIGNSEYAFYEASNLKNYTNDITIYTNGSVTEISPKFENKKDEFKIEERKIKAFSGENRIESIVFEDGSTDIIDGVFIANNTPNINDFALSVGLITNSGKIIVDSKNMTNIEGVFACGDMVNSFNQVSTAVGSGALAAHSCTRYLIENKKY
ncbi:MAG: FAD-dependent oxidoreductase [Clostridia bacterium]|nr:FAD-dependent oxidoreductase [Clostridia bacterium]